MLKYYRNLLNDRLRIENFRQAITELVSRDSVVVEVGSALGTYSFFAARAGAKRIYAIEMNTIFYLGRELARRNGLVDRINFIHGRSTDINLPEKADLIILEDYGPFFYNQNIIETIRDARQRYLKPDGCFIPAKLALFIAPFECQAWYNELNLFATEQDNLFGIDWSLTSDIAFNLTYYADNKPKRILTEACSVKTIDLKTEADFPFQIRTKLTILEDGVIHGLLGWWDCWFTGKQYFSNSPLLDQTSWGQLIFPFRYPVIVKAGEQIEISLMVLESQTGGNIDYKWQIKHDSGQQEQNTFSGRFFDLAQFRKIRRDTVPVLNSKGLIDQFILNQIDGKRTWDEIAELVRSAFPDQFIQPEDVFKLITSLTGLIDTHDQ